MTNALEFLRLACPDLSPVRTKLHLATFNGSEDPLDEFVRGDFEEWQRWQSKRNFEREQVLSLIMMGDPSTWLFAGIHASLGWEERNSRGRFYYELTERPEWSEWNGRLVVRFVRPGRQSYLNLERWEKQIHVREIFAERIKVGEFPGFRDVNLSMADLRSVVTGSAASWRAALSSVAGVYVITDAETGRLYVGSATGQGGIWARWSHYASTGHGGNIELKALLAEQDGERDLSLHFAILEVADVNASDEDLLSREEHWKRVLLSRAHGLNAN